LTLPRRSRAVSVSTAQERRNIAHCLANMKDLASSVDAMNTNINQIKLLAKLAEG